MASNFSTTITRVKNKLEIKHPYSTSIYNKEFARRKSKQVAPNEDTRYDLINFFLDLKRGLSDVFQQRKWQDDFVSQPTGIFDPESATELRFSPANTLFRHGWVIRTGLENNLNDKTKYINSEGNSNLETQLIGGFPIKENGDFNNSDFRISRYNPQEIEFEHEVDYSIDMRA